jgi:hypothetical protein
MPQSTERALCHPRGQGRSRRHRRREGKPGWITFALAATFAQWALEGPELLTPMMEGASDVFVIQRHGGFRRDAHRFSGRPDPSEHSFSPSTYPRT